MCNTASILITAAKERQVKVDRLTYMALLPSLAISWHIQSFLTTQILRYQRTNLILWTDENERTNAHILLCFWKQSSPSRERNQERSVTQKSISGAQQMLKVTFLLSSVLNCRTSRRHLHQSLYNSSATYILLSCVETDWKSIMKLIQVFQGSELRTQQDIRTEAKLILHLYPCVVFSSDVAVPSTKVFTSQNVAGCMWFC